MDTATYLYEHLNQLDIFEISVFVGLTLVILLTFLFYLSRKKSFLTHAYPINHTQNTGSKKQHPEVLLLILAFPAETLWEFAQLPLYTIWYDSDWGYILYAVAHCTLGDMLILLSIYIIVSSLNRNRHWFLSNPIPNTVLFTVLGLGYTIYSEIINTQNGAWAYTESMPVIPVIGIGGAPFMQWVIIPPIIIGLMRRVSSRQPD